MLKALLFAVAVWAALLLGFFLLILLCAVVNGVFDAADERLGLSRLFEKLLCFVEGVADCACQATIWLLAFTGFKSR